MFVDLLDEIAGIAWLALPDLQAAFGVSTAVVMFAAFTVPGVVAMVAEPVVFLVADRRPEWRKALVVGGLAGMGLALVAGSLSPGIAAFALATSMVWVCDGAGVTLARATLMDADPDRRALWMTRWVMAGTLGDLAAPLLLSALAWAGFGWRAAMATVGGMVLAHAAVLAAVRFPAPAGDEDDEDVPLGDALRAALGDRELLGWLAGVSLCGLLDEVFVGLGSVWLERAYGADLAVRGLVFALGTAGGVAGLFVLERALAAGADPLRWLRGACVGTALALAAWLLAPSLLWSAVLLVILEALAVMLYPLAKARAFAAMPGRSAMVEAVAGLFGPVELVVPLLVGLVADRVGVAWAIAALAVQPLGLLAVAWAHGRERRST